MAGGMLIPAQQRFNTRLRIKGTQLYVRQEPAFDGASRSRRVRNWNPDARSINTLIGGLQRMRNRSRSLAQNVPWIDKGVGSLVANIVGNGIKPRSRAEKTSFKEAVAELWRDWIDEADAHGVLDLDLLQAQAVRATIEGGECFVRIRRRKTEDGLSVPLQLQTLDAEYVPVEKTERLPNGNKVVCGIEFNALGRRVAYYMYKEHPGDLLSSTDLKVTTRVPAAEVIHLFDPRRPGQVRGIPWLSSVMLRARDMLEYEDAELVRKKNAAMFTAFVTRPDPEDDLLNEDDEDFEVVDDEGVAITELEPGTVQLLEPGEDVRFSEPADVGGSYEIFLKTQLRAIAAGLGVTYEQMTGDLTGVNFSSIRAGLLEFQRRAKLIQKLVIFQFCQPVWRAWMHEAVFVGALDAPGFGFNPKPWNRVTWVPPGWQYVNPSQEFAASKGMVRSGFKARGAVVAEIGEDVAEVDRQNAEDQQRADDLGLVYDTDPRQTTNSGGVADRDEDEELVPKKEDADQ